ncbi:MAG TPA: SdpI family protein [bacterium]|nr:SdpI family protein [bacterium]
MKSPIKISWRTELLPGLLIVLAIAIGFYFYAHFPETVITHWNIQGQADGWSSKWFGAFFLPLLLIALHLLFIVIPFFDPQKERYQEFAKTYQLFKLLIIGTMFLIYLFSGLINLGYNLNIGSAVSMIIGALFVVMGNYLGKLKYNWFVGIKTPWSLSSENVWNKTHRVGGWLFILMGIAIIIVPYLPANWGLALFWLAIIVGVLGSMGYSYFAYHQEKK